jgi:hypothetical protein
VNSIDKQTNFKDCKPKATLSPDDNTPKRWLFVVDGDIPTTKILNRMWRAIQQQHPTIQFSQHVAQHVSVADLEGAYGVFFCRVCTPSILPFLQHVKRKGLKSVMYLDDNFFLLTVRPPLSDLYQQPDHLMTLTMLLQQCDRVMVNNANMASYLRPLNAHIVQTPGFLDMTLLASGSPLPPSPVTPALITIGFLAERNKANDYQPVFEALRQLLDTPEGQHIRLECFGPAPEALGDLPQLTSLPRIDDYAHFIQAQQARGWHFGLAPLAPWPFNRFKTNNKFREFGGCGIVGLYSSLASLDTHPDAPDTLCAGPYDECVTDGVNGLLVTSHSCQAWVDALQRAIGLTPLQRHALATQAYHDVTTHYSLQTALPHWHRAITFGAIPL